MLNSGRGSHSGSGSGGGGGAEAVVVGRAAGVVARVILDKVLMMFDVC